ncbi:MAG: 1-(5-phosphoribosyl)-5-[(5-phosphoribosylamino)methylideneamino]imidazole-4-carboxamide isomerase [Proteobacteria bacterium]|nr:1-(5-phosphoribosyl)-5-[(5-phosphoribosylamino)methylideneamino]imidazole-4-carboxamide isomerase [Pseudomonadota bacterium]
MILYPAIDVKDGQVVRLLRGEMDTATVFNDDPAAQARAFEAAGFGWLHLVDLNGAFEGRPVNRAAVEAILAAVAIPAQLGGGIRNMATIESWLEAGIARVILGTVAVKDPELVRAACREFPGRIALGIDARGGRVAVEGWAEVSAIETLELARRFEDAGAAAIIFTDISRDGALQGVNVEATAALAGATRLPVIASGGVAALDDIDALMAASDAIQGDSPQGAAVQGGGIQGAIIGRALYDGRIDPAAALALVSARARADA